MTNLIEDRTIHQFIGVSPLVFQDLVQDVKMNFPTTRGREAKISLQDFCLSFTPYVSYR